MKVIYVSSELFINEFIDAIQHSNLVKFRKRYRQVDLLLIDDIQFLGGKERSRKSSFTHSIRFSMDISRSSSPAIGRLPRLRIWNTAWFRALSGG